jgi:hypothetical protein
VTPNQPLQRTWPAACAVASALPFRVAGPASEWQGRWAVTTLLMTKRVVLLCALVLCACKVETYDAGEFHRVLPAKDFGKIQVGWSPEQVERAFGKPATVVTGVLEEWHYPVMIGDPPTLFDLLLRRARDKFQFGDGVVYLSAGKVVRVQIMRGESPPAARTK